MREGEEVMIRRHFLNLVFGVAAGIAAFAATANAAPLPPISAAQSLVLPRAGAEPAVVAQDEFNRLQPEQVRWHHHHHWHHRHWHHWHHHHWHHRHWHHWHHHHWHHWHHHHWRHHHWHHHHHR